MSSHDAAVRHITPAIVVVLMTGALVVGWLSVPASATDEAEPRLDDDPRAVALLRRAMDVPQRVSYTGTQYMSAWSGLDRAASTSAIVNIQHTAGVATVVEGHDGSRTSLPTADGSDPWLGGSGGPIGLLANSYDVQVTGQAEVAGRAVEVVEASRADSSTAAKLWIDAQHALPLRREVYDEQGRMVSATAFVEIDVIATGPRPANRGLRMPNTQHISTEATPLSQPELDNLRANGWLCPDQFDGNLTLYEAYRYGDAVQLSYSDGVATLSVFEQPGQLDPATLEGFTAREVDDGVVYVNPGPPSQLTWSTDGDRVITVVADGTVSSVDVVMTALPPMAAQQPAGLLDRVSRGAKRVGAWLNPFD